MTPALPPAAPQPAGSRAADPASARARTEPAPGDFAALLGRSLEADPAVTADATPPGSGKHPTREPASEAAAPVADGSHASLTATAASPRTAPGSDAAAAGAPAQAPAPSAPATDPSAYRPTAATLERSDPGDAQPTAEAGARAARPAVATAVPIAEPGAAKDGRTAAAASAQTDLAAMPATDKAVDSRASADLQTATASATVAAAARSAAAAAPPSADLVAVAAPLMPASAAAAPAGGALAAGAAPQALLPQPPGSPAFAAALGQQVGLWLRQGVPQAVLQLHPAELGPVAVRITLDGTQAHVDFTALHAATRSAIEASLPALAGALREGGLTLAGGGVFDRPRDPGDGSRPGTPATRENTPAEHASAAPAAAPALPHRRGIVDLVA